MPDRIRRAFEAWAGSPVASAVSQVHGFSPGVAARLKLADGRGLFVKAISAEPNADAPVFHRREARIVGSLPADVPVPRLQWVYDEGEKNGGWIVLVFDEADGVHPRQPWQPDELQQVLDGMAQLFGKLTPSPLAIGSIPSASDRVRRHIRGWQQLLHSDPAEVRQQLDPWSQRHLAKLAELEEQAPAAVIGDTLLHFDIRADNVLIGAEHVWFFDWPHACIGADWFDVIGLAPSVSMQGGPPPEEVFARYTTRGSADPLAVTCAIATLAGYFIRQSLLLPPPGLPTLRVFQAAQGAVACQWLAQRTGLD